MKKYMMDIIKSSIISIGIALTIFCILGIYFDQQYAGHFYLESYRFTQMVLACAAIGLGFGVPSFIYQVDRIPYPMRVTIHLGIGFSVYLLTSYQVGWIGVGQSIWDGFILPLIVQTLVIVLIWFGFSRHYKKEADAINQKIRGRTR